MKLSLRLQCIADMVEKNSYIADIGTDHAYLPIYLIKNKICSRAIATDVRVGPLHRAERNVTIYNLHDRILLRQGYGLAPLAVNEVECAVLAGMGGYLVCDILESGKDIAKSIEHFIIQPIQAPEAVREYLYKNGFRILDEVLVKESGKIYQAMKVGHGLDFVDDHIYYEIGKKLIDKKDPLLTELVNMKIDETEKVIIKIGNQDTENASRRLDECSEMLKKYREVLKCL